MGVLWDNSIIDVSSINLQTGRYYFVGFTRNGTAGDWTSKIYIDGILDETLTGITTDPGDCCSSGSTFNAIGRPGEFDGQYWNGIIDEVRVYDRALSAAEVLELYQGK